MESKVLEVPETKIDVRIIQRAKMDIRIIRIIVEMGLIFLRIAVLCPTYMAHTIRNIEKKRTNNSCLNRFRSVK